MSSLTTHLVAIAAAWPEVTTSAYSTIVTATTTTALTNAVQDMTSLPKLAPAQPKIGQS